MLDWDESRSVLRKRSAALVVLLATLLIAGAAAAEAGWGEYANARYAYHICYPSGIFTPGEEAADGDGVAFTSSEDASLIVYGRNNVLNDSVSATAKEAATRLAGTSGKTSLFVVRSNAFAVSGTQGAQIFYAKGLLKDDQYKIFEMTYPAALAAKYNRIVEKIAACFGGG